VIQIYAELAGRKLQQAPIVPAALIRFRNQTPLTKDEVLYALDTEFGWAGIKMVPAGDNSIKPVFNRGNNP
jgi:hypothetical protein